MRKLGGIAVLTCGVTLSGYTYAENTQLHGFVRAAGAMSLSKEQKYLERIDKDGDTGDSHFGLTASSQLSDKWDVAGQIFSSAREGTEVVLDWAYGTYRPVDELKLSFGRIKYPTLLASEYVDIGVSYLWIRPPQELYTFETEHGVNLSLEAFNGGSISYDGSAGNFEYSLQAYGGDAKISDGQLSRMMGARFKAGTDNFTIQAGYGRYRANIVSGLRQAELNGKDVTVISAGAMADVANIVFAAEWANGAAGDDDHLKNSAYYGTIGYRIKSVTPHVTYSVFDREGGRTVITGGIKYQIIPAATFKVEVAQVAAKAEEGGETPEAFQTVSAAFDLVF